jgi:hypothetical protein
VIQHLLTTEGTEDTENTQVSQQINSLSSSVSSVVNSLSLIRENLLKAGVRGSAEDPARHLNAGGGQLIPREDGVKSADERGAGIW